MKDTHSNNFKRSGIGLAAVALVDFLEQERLYKSIIPMHSIHTEIKKTNVAQLCVCGNA